MGQALLAPGCPAAFLRQKRKRLVGVLRKCIVGADKGEKIVNADIGLPLFTD